MLNGKERLSATTTTTTKEKIQCSWFKRRKRKANAFDYSTLGRDGNDDDDDDDDDEELEEDQEEKDECVGVDCIGKDEKFYRPRVRVWVPKSIDRRVRCEIR